MSATFDTSRHQASNDQFRVMAPSAGAMLSGALHSAFDRYGALPADMLNLLGKLDRIDGQRR